MSMLAAALVAQQHSHQRMQIQQHQQMLDGTQSTANLLPSSQLNTQTQKFANSSLSKNSYGITINDESDGNTSNESTKRSMATTVTSPLNW